MWYFFKIYIHRFIMPWISLLKSMRRSAWVWTCWKRSIKHLGQDIMIRSDNNYNAQQRSFRRPDQRSTMLNDTRQFLLYDVAKRHSRSKWSSWICLSKFVPLSSSIPPLTLRQLRSDSQWYCLYSGGITQAVPTNARRPLCPPHVFANVANSHQKHTFQDSTYASQRNVFLVNSKKKKESAKPGRLFRVTHADLSQRADVLTTALRTEKLPMVIAAERGVQGAFCGLRKSCFCIILVFYCVYLYVSYSFYFF